MSYCRDLRPPENLVNPRLNPVSLETADAPTRELFDSMRPQARTMNVFRTFAHHPDLMRSWLGFGAYLLRSSTLEPRLRELVVLRVGWLCRSPYEWGQHVNLGRKFGVLDADLTRHFSTKQVLDLIFLVGQYQLVAGALNALRVERDDGLDASELPFPMS